MHARRLAAPLLTGIAALALAAPCAAQARATLTVRVTDEQGTPIPGAGVWVEDRSALTGADGRARLEGIRPGPHFVRIRADGRQAESVALEFTAGAAVEIEAALQPFTEVVPLPVLTVEAERQRPHLRDSGFYTRRQSAFGSFLERNEKAPWDHLPTTAMLFHGVRGFKVAYEGNSYVIRSTRGAVGLGKRECTPLIVVDGMPWPDEDLSAIPPSEIEAIEAYAGPASSPPQFAFNARGTSCGTILIWRRRGHA